MKMRLLSVNVGIPRAIGRSQGEKVISGIFKVPVDGPVAVRKLGLEGDGQADHAVHGGINKAVYVYPSEHYAYWRERFPDKEMPWGTFGENFTTTGLLEGSAHVGDRLAIGTAEFAITQPRLPCFKLGIKFGTQTMVKTFMDSERSGFYLSVLKEGEVEAENPITRVGTNGNPETIASIVLGVKKSGEYS